MQKLIHNAVRSALSNRPDRRRDSSLWVSDLGRNPYAAIRRVMTGELEPFDYPTLIKMDNGSAMEAHTLRQVAENLGRPVQTQFPLFDTIWTGYADLVIGHDTDDVIIYDHKGSAGKWWDYRESLPRSSDCCQVWLYGQLYAQQYGGIVPRTGLYYRGWGAWAEFEIKEAESGRIEATGHITDEKGENEIEVVRYRDINPLLLKGELEELHQRAISGNYLLDELVTDPSGPDWDYAEGATIRLEASQTDA